MRAITPGAMGVAAFESEAGRLKKLSHPRLVRVLCIVGEVEMGTQSPLMLIMQYTESHIGYIASTFGQNGANNLDLRCGFHRQVLRESHVSNPVQRFNHISFKIAFTFMIALSGMWRMGACCPICGRGCATIQTTSPSSTCSTASPPMLRRA